MNTKLTLSIEENTIKRAKDYAKSHNRSLSDLIETYLNALTVEDSNEDIEISPYVRSISAGHTIAADLDHRAEYGKHLDKKYK